jgi:hypothetical protein
MRGCASVFASFIELARARRAGKNLINACLACWDFLRSMVAAERLWGDARPQPVPMVLTKKNRTGIVRLSASPASNHRRPFPLRYATSLEIFRSTNGKKLGLWTADFEPVRHRLDAWESRANGGFGFEDGAQQVRLCADKKIGLLQ